MHFVREVMERSEVMPIHWCRTNNAIDVLGYQNHSLCGKNVSLSSRCCTNDFSVERMIASSLYADVLSDA